MVEVAAVVVGATVEAGAGGTLVTAGAVVVVTFVVVDAGGIVVAAVVGADLSWLVVSVTGRDPPGAPPSTSAPMHRAANPSSPTQPRQARPRRRCWRDRSIASSSTDCGPT